MCDSEKIMSIITNLSSGLGGVCIGAWITYYLQEKSTIKKKKTETLTNILKTGYTGVALVCLVAEAAMIFQSQSINSNLEEIFRIYSSKDNNPEEARNKLNTQFIELAKSMRENIGISKDILTDEVIEKAIAGNYFGR